MESLLEQLNRQDVWNEFVAYRLLSGRYDWKSFCKADSFVENGEYASLVAELVEGGGFSVRPRKICVNKSGGSGKRIVYIFPERENMVLGLISFLIYRYNECFAPNCYAFRRGICATDAVRDISASVAGRSMWAYKLDIHDYFNSINVNMLLSELKEMMADNPPLYSFFSRLLTMEGGSAIGHGVLAGTPTASFLANVYLNRMDHHFYDVGAVYARYSDDIIVFASDRETLDEYASCIHGFLDRYGLRINKSKEAIYAPSEAFEFLGFSCHGYDIDISSAALHKMKAKIRRRTRSLMRRQTKGKIPAQYTALQLAEGFNRKFFGSGDKDMLSWSRWFFPLINRTSGLHEIDRYMQECMRYLCTGRHSRSGFRKADHAMLRRLGYRSLVNAYYRMHRVCGRVSSQEGLPNASQFRPV